MPNSQSRGYYNTLEPRVVKPTKFLCENSMAILGVLDGITALYRNIGWENFLGLRAHTYDGPTKEFLATFDRDDDTRSLTFQLMGRSFTIPYDQVNQIMRTTTNWTDRPDDRAPRGYDHGVQCWEQMSGIADFNSSVNKASDIHHPCLRIAHRLLTSTIFGRVEAGQLTTTEIYFLWCMTRVPAPQIDFASYFLKKCHETRRQKAGVICIGGLITLIGRGVGLDFSHLEPVEGAAVINITALVRMHSLIQRGPHTYVWCDEDGFPYCFIPSDGISAFDATNPATWTPPRSIAAPEPIAPPEQATIVGFR